MWLGGAPELESWSWGSHAPSQALGCTVRDLWPLSEGCSGGKSSCWRGPASPLGLPPPKMFQRRMEMLTMRWEELGVKEAQLKAYIQKFEQFIQVCPP